MGKERTSQTLLYIQLQRVDNLDDNSDISLPAALMAYLLTEAGIVDPRMMKSLVIIVQVFTIQHNTV